MTILNDIKSIRGNELLMFVLLFIATLGPGFLVIYQYKPDIAKEYDILKLLLFSGAITVPIFAWNTSLASIWQYASERQISISDNVYEGSIVTTVIFYPLLFAAHCRGWTFLRFACWLIGFVCVVTAVAFALVVWKARKNET